MTYKVFICYENRTGASYAENLKIALEKDPNYKAYLFSDDNQGGDVWERKRDLALEESQFFVVIITGRTFHSEEVKKEYKTAIKLNKRIIPCRYLDIEPSDTRELAKLHQIEFKNENDLANKVTIEIEKILKLQKEIENDYEEFARRGNLFFYSKQLDKALDAYNKSIELNPDSAEIWYNRGVILTDSELFEEALISYNKAIELKHDYPEAWNNKGIIFSKQGKFDKAIEAFNKAIELKDSYVAWNNKGNTFTELREFDKAIEAFNKAIELKDSYYAWNNIGVVLLRLKKFSKAIDAFDKALDIKGDYVYAIYNKACIFSWMKDKNNMIKTLGRLIELDSKYKRKIKNDKAFKNFWDDEDFKKLVE